jgi:hypothetical protein
MVKPEDLEDPKLPAATVVELNLDIAQSVVHPEDVGTAALAT